MGEPGWAENNDDVSSKANVDRIAYQHQKEAWLSNSVTIAAR